MGAYYNYDLYFRNIDTGEILTSTSEYKKLIEELRDSTDAPLNDFGNESNCGQWQTLEQDLGSFSLKHPEYVMELSAESNYGDDGCYFFWNGQWHYGEPVTVHPVFCKEDLKPCQLEKTCLTDSQKSS